MSDPERDGPPRAVLIAALLIAVAAASLLALALGLPVQTIGSRFGGIPSALPSLQWPDFSWATARFLFSNPAIYPLPNNNGTGISTGPRMAIHAATRRISAQRAGSSGYRWASEAVGLGWVCVVGIGTVVEAG